jgi:hypothetical protein
MRLRGNAAVSMGRVAGYRAVERRQHARVTSTLRARYVLANQREYFGTVIDASPDGLAIEAAECGQLGDRVIIDVDGVDRFRGEIVRHFPGGFAIRLLEDQAAAAMALAGTIERQRMLTQGY